MQMALALVRDWWVFTGGQVKVLAHLPGLVFYRHRLDVLLGRNTNISLAEATIADHRRVHSCMLTVCLHGEAFRGGAGLNTRGGSSTD